VLALGGVALDERLEARLGQEPAPDPVHGRREPGDRGGGKQAAGPQHARGLGQGAVAIGRLGEVIQRLEQARLASAAAATPL